MQELIKNGNERQNQQPRAFDARLDAVPLKPGVYLMKDANASIIYVGKAGKLRNRLRSYFGKGAVQSSPKVEAMLRHVADFSFVVCANELEAFILESNLIKQYRPFYNILLKDDRDYPYIKVTLQEAYPRIFKAYRIGPDIKDGARYYGPYLNGDVNRAIRSIHDLFPLKTCRRIFPRDIGKGRPCLNYHIHRCIAPCTGEVSEAEYRELMEEVCRFLEGRYSDVLRRAETRMQAAAEAMRFEEAALWRDRIRDLKALGESQVAVTDSDEDCDVIGLSRGDGLCCVMRLVVRGGKVSAASTHFLEAGDESEHELLAAFISQYYENSKPPGLILIPFELEETERDGLETLLEARLRLVNEEEAAVTEGPAPLARASAEEKEFAANSDSERYPAGAAEREAWLESLLRVGEISSSAYDQRAAKTPLPGPAGSKKRRRYHRVRLRHPKRGDKTRLLDMAARSARDNLLRTSLRDGRADAARREAWTLLEQLYGLEPGRLLRVEAYDIANYGGADKSCAMVVFEQAKPLKKAYRRFRIRSVEGQDDYASMREALERRLDRLDDHDFAARPQLILLDGGPQHLAMARQLMATRETNIVLGAMVKDDRHRSAELLLPDGERIDLRALAKGTEGAAGSERLKLAQAQILLNLITRIQDECHRFAGQYTRTLHRKRQIRYDLESIPGVGPARRDALLKAYSSVAAIAAADVESLLAKVPSLGRKAAEAVVRHFETRDGNGNNDGNSTHDETKTHDVNGTDKDAELEETNDHA